MKVEVNRCGFRCTIREIRVPAKVKFFLWLTEGYEEYPSEQQFEEFSPEPSYEYPDPA